MISKHLNSNELRRDIKPGTTAINPTFQIEEPELQEPAPHQLTTKNSQMSISKHLSFNESLDIVPEQLLKIP